MMRRILACAFVVSIGLPSLGVAATFGKLPLIFEANEGQADPSVRFFERGSGYGLFLTKDGAVLALHGKKGPATALRMTLAGASVAAEASGVEKLAGVANSFIG